jgi:hypothetical protein
MFLVPCCVLVYYEAASKQVMVYVFNSHSNHCHQNVLMIKKNTFNVTTSDFYLERCFLPATGQ